MSLTDLKHLKERTAEAGRLVDLADRRLTEVLMKLNATELAKYGKQINNILNLLNAAEAKLR